MKNPNEHLVLSTKCLPTSIPLLWTVVAWMLTDLYTMPVLVVCILWAYIFCKWLYFIASEVLDVQMDIFENFRFAKKEED